MSTGALKNACRECLKALHHRCRYERFCPCAREGHPTMLVGLHEYLLDKTVAKAMANAWQEGHDLVCDFAPDCTLHHNPFKEA